MTDVYRPNFNFNYSEKGYDVSFVVACNGFTSRNPSRWIVTQEEAVASCFNRRLDSKDVKIQTRFDKILDSMIFLGKLYGDRYCPTMEEDFGFSRIVFDAIEISYRSFRTRFNSLTKEQCEKFYRNGVDPFLVSSAYNAFLGIFDSFYSDICDDDARLKFIDALWTVEQKCKGDEQ